jgi:hypothetical protein
MNAETYEAFTREDSATCRVLVLEASSTEGSSPSNSVFFIEEPREQLLPDIQNQGWYIAEGSKLRYQRGPVDDPRGADSGSDPS